MVNYPSPQKFSYVFFHTSLKILASLFIFFSLMACSFFGHEKEFLTGKEEIELALPVWPPHQENCSYPELDFWLIECETSEKSESFTASKNEKSVTFLIPENSPASFCARPITKCLGQSVSFFYNSGCVYPQNKTTFLWNDGFAASLLSSLYRASFDRKETAESISLFNWQKFIDALHQKEAASILEIKTASALKCDIEDYPEYYNPWRLDKNEILYTISQKTFNAYKLSFPDFISLSRTSEILQPTDGIKNLISPYIPENEVFQKLEFLTIMKRTENCSQFLYKNCMATITVTSSGNPELVLCTIPLY